MKLRSQLSAQNDSKIVCTRRPNAHALCFKTEWKLSFSASSLSMGVLLEAGDFTARNDMRKPHG